MRTGGNYNDDAAGTTMPSTEVDRIRDQFRRAFDGEAWHGPSVLALLKE